MKRLPSPAVLVLALFWAGFSSQAQNPAPPQQERPMLLRPVFEPGKTYRFTSNTNVYMAPPGEPQRRIVMAQQARYDASARAGKQKGVSLRGLTERLQVNIQSGQQTVAYDSLKKGNQTTKIGKHFESTVNRYVTMELDEKLKIVSHKEGGRSAGATPLPGLPRFGPEELVQIISSRSRKAMLRTR